MSLQSYLGLSGSGSKQLSETETEEQQEDALESGRVEGEVLLWGVEERSEVAGGALEERSGEGGKEEVIREDEKHLRGRANLPGARERQGRVEEQEREGKEEEEEEDEEDASWEERHNVRHAVMFRFFTVTHLDCL